MIPWKSAEKSFSYFGERVSGANVGKRELLTMYSLAGSAPADLHGDALPARECTVREFLTPSLGF